MPRRRCCGLVEPESCCRKFVPVDVQKTSKVTLLVEELEAIRLKDCTDMDQFKNQQSVSTLCWLYFIPKH